MPAAARGFDQASRDRQRFLIVLADRVGILDRGRLLSLDSAAGLRRRYAAATLEDAFLAATGRALEDGEDEDEEAA